MITAASCDTEEAPVENRSPPAPTAPAPREIPEGLRPVAILIQRGALPEAREAIALYRHDNPDDPYGAFLQGMVDHRAKRYSEAEPRFLEALELDPGYDLVHHFLGWARYYNGDMSGARESFVAHLAADPEESDSMFGLGLVELEEGRLDEAEQRFDAAIAIIESLEATDPGRFARRRGDLGKCHARLGDVAFARGEYERARALLEQAIAEDPDQYTAYFKLSQVERRLGNPNRAEELEKLHAEMLERRGE